MNIVFDIGNVLVRWDPALAWIDADNSRSDIESFLERINFRDLNVRGDAGESFVDLASDIADEDDRRRLEGYVDRFPLTVAEKVDGTWAILEELIAGEHAVHAITNWSAETWPKGCDVHPRLRDAFETLIVSGVERVSKPDLAIFELLCERAGVAPETCLFIDDSAKNVAGAVAAGWQAILFVDAPALRRDLESRGVL